MLGRAEMGRKEYARAIAPLERARNIYVEAEKSVEAAEKAGFRILPGLKAEEIAKRKSGS